MPYQTGTFTNLNDVLRTVRDFLVAQGWTIHVNYREPLLLNRITDHRSGPPPFDVLHWRWAQRLAMSKGTKFFTAQDFYLMGDNSYGTGGTSSFTNGPGIAIIAGTTATNLVDPDTEVNRGADHPAWYRPYTLAMDGVTPVYAQDLTGPVLLPTWYNDVANPSPSMVMPLPMVTGQENGTWATGDNFWVNGFPNNDTELYAPFGVAGGAATPLPYWLFYDTATDSWLLVVVHDTIAATIKTVYMGMGTLNKAGDWVGNADYVCAARAAGNAFTGTDVTTYPLIGHEINRFAPPGAVADDAGMTFGVRLPAVDSSPAAWQGVGAGARRLLTTAEMDVITTGGLGTKSGFGFGSLTGLRSSMQDAAPGLPVYFTIQRDSGLQSMVGSLPNIYKAHTAGFSFGTETQAPDGTHYIVFDGFMVKKVP